MDTHYRNHPLLPSSSWIKSSVPYLFNEKSSSGSGGVGGDGNKVREPIYNARELRIMEESKLMMTQTQTQKMLLSNNTKVISQSSFHRHLLKKYGMTLVNSPTKINDWKNRRKIEDVYIQELEHILPTLFSSSSSSSSSSEIEMYCFWNPMLRGESHELSSPYMQEEAHDDKDDEKNHRYSIPTANVASAVHIDTDVGAYESLDDFLTIIEKNQVIMKKRQQSDHRNDDDKALKSSSFDKKKYQTAISKEKKRFAIVNFWRSTDRDVPVTTSPLAILSPRYEKNSNDNHDIGSSCRAFPTLCPDLEKSKWYTFPNMTNDEILVFYQYDRLATQPSDLWHCALSLPVEDDDDSINSAQDNNDANGNSNSNSYIDYSNTTTNNNTERSLSHLRVNDASTTTTTTTATTSSRESFDIRALIVFDDVIDYVNDRFHPERIQPVLSIEESGCFCDEQAIKKRTQ